MTRVLPLDSPRLIRQNPANDRATGATVVELKVFA
jgi:hypothetical protein